MNRREMLALLGGAAGLGAAPAPAGPVALARGSSYDDDLVALLSGMFDQLGGLATLVRERPSPSS